MVAPIAARAALRSVRLASSIASSTAISRNAVKSGAQFADARERPTWLTQLAALALAGSVTMAAAAAENEPRSALIAAVVDAEATDAASASEPKARGRRSLLKKRTQHTAKLEEVDLMKSHLDEYRASRRDIGSLRARFDAYASRTVGAGEDAARAMTFTDFLHSLILPRFRLQEPRAGVEYSCDFVGDANSLITYEECYVLIHLLQMDKAEFCHVIENLLRTITKGEAGGPLTISAESTLPRLTKYLFGRRGNKRIKAQELEAVLDLLRKQVLKAEFDLYAKPHPSAKHQEVVSVHDFAITLVSCFDPERLAPYLERLQALNASQELVTWDDFYKFHFNVQSNLEDIKLAFDLIGAAEITEADFIRAARVVSGVELSFPVVQLAFRVFDGNDNGTLDQTELLKVLEMRRDIELEKKQPATYVKRFWSCVREAPSHH
ncbi:hypothetical protein PybrP1_009534 [[Pythium] brassicae (nom. inval.)]|nr:hypothetical protein PybrP1_009534 [[Pythium] brassicae (nom. inval.)]